MKSAEEPLLETLNDLSHKEFKQFKLFLLHTDTKKGHCRIPKHRLRIADKVKTVELMRDTYGQQSVEVIRKVLKKMDRTNLARKLSDIRSSSKGKVDKNNSPISKMWYVYCNILIILIHFILRF